MGVGLVKRVKNILLCALKTVSFAVVCCLNPCMCLYIHTHSQDGETALHGACSGGHTDCVRLLLASNANANAATEVWCCFCCVLCFDLAMCCATFEFRFSSLLSLAWQATFSNYNTFIVFWASHALHVGPVTSCSQWPCVTNDCPCTHHTFIPFISFTHLFSFSFIHTRTHRHQAQ